MSMTHLNFNSFYKKKYYNYLMSNITSILFIILCFFIIFIFVSHIYFHFSYIGNNLQKYSNSKNYNRSITQPSQQYLAYQQDQVYDYDNDFSLLYQPIQTTPTTPTTSTTSTITTTPTTSTTLTTPTTLTTQQ